MLGTAIPAMELQGWAVVAIGALAAVWVVAPGFAEAGKRRQARRPEKRRATIACT